MIVFPAVDIQGGKAVRLRRGDFRDVTVFGDDPLELAKMWEARGAEALHVVDLDAARTGELANFASWSVSCRRSPSRSSTAGASAARRASTRSPALGVRWAVMGTAAVTAERISSIWAWSVSATASSWVWTAARAWWPRTAGSNARR